MALNKQKLALASATTFGVAYVVCVAFVALWPGFSLQLFGYLFHLIDVNKFVGGMSITFGGVIAGLIEVVVYAYLTAWLFAWFYNRFAGQKA